ncbi:MAG: hypothetical protein NTX47_02195 [Candidatus Omnitrophica bacterium]|nr:hypothetical protein [Candidatus Omnitrophota bacterium]
MSVKALKFLIILNIALAAGWSHAVTAEENWQEFKGEHFIVYFIQDQKFAKDALDKAEVYYRNIASDLGYARYTDFWLWDKRVKIYIYPDHPSFIKATGQPQWSQGIAEYRKKQIVSYAWSKDFLESLLPHEIAHLVFRDFVGFKGQIPLWLDEGVAQREEEARRQIVKAAAKNFFEKDLLLSMKDMMEINLDDFKEIGRIYIRATRTKKGESGVLFLSAENIISTYYLEAASLVSFLIEKYGSDSFAYFCRELRDGKSLEDAFRAAYTTYIKDIEELDLKWRQYLEEG